MDNEGPAGIDERLGEAMLYVARRLAERGDPHRGAVKLNKVLWWADFESFRRTGRPVTGAAYQRLSEGPAPVRLLPVRESLIAGGSAHLEQSDRGAPRPQTEFVADREPEAGVLSEADRQALDQAVEMFLGRTGRQCSEISHRVSVGWQVVGDGEVIPYETALLDPEPQALPPGSEERVARLLAAHRSSIAGTV